MVGVDRWRLTRHSKSKPRHSLAPRDDELELAVIVITTVVTVLPGAPTVAIVPAVIVDGSCVACGEVAATVTTGAALVYPALLQ